MTITLTSADETATHAGLARCESVHHAEGVEGHSGPAAWLMISTCTHGTGFRCDGFVQFAKRNPGMGSCICGNRDQPTFIPLSMDSRTEGDRE